MSGRLLVVKIEVMDCEAEVLLNGMPIARASAARNRVVMPVHEYAVEGDNQLELVLWPHPAQLVQSPMPVPKPWVSTGNQAARVRMLLPRSGNLADENSARTLAQIDWAAPEGTACELPLTLSQQLTLPASFPRWRWLDAPLLEPTSELRPIALGFVQELAQGLSAGDFDAFQRATRLRHEELAVAYQFDAAQAAARLREHLASAHAAQRLNWLPMDDQSLVLRPVARGRLVECLDATGAAMLRTAPDELGRSMALPLRLAAVERQLFVLR